MDDLLHLASQLADQSSAPLFAPIRGRIAYVVSHGQSYASNGYAIRTQGIAQALNQHGFETLCFVRPGRPWELAGWQGHVAPESLVNGVRYIHSRWPGGKRPDDELDRLKANAARFEELFRVYRPEAVLAASNYRVGLPAWIAAKRLGLPFYNEVRGFWELSRDAREPGYAHSSAGKQETARDSFVARQAHRVFTLNRPMQEELGRRGVEQGKIDIVPNGVSELPKIKPADPTLKQTLAIQEDDKVVGYVGSFGAYEGLDLLLEACNDLVEKGENLKLLLVGDNQSVAEATGVAKVLADQPWLIQVGRVPHEQVADYYALIDLVVIPRKSLPVCELVPPMKVAEALAYGKRLVVSDVAPLAEHAQQHDGVVSFEAGNATSLAQALQRSLKLPAPKPSTELRFSAHTAPMVKALKGKGSKGTQPVALASASVRKISNGAVSPKFSSDYKVAIIADEFTSNSFAGEFQALPLEPDNWLDMFQDHQPDMFFCESTWAGPDPVKRPWRGKVYASINFPNENRKTLLSILEYCKKAGIPSVFWNKEDPTHHNDRVHDFVKTAALFDYVFTTAEECVESYKENYGVKNAFALPFGTNPRLFNPVETTDRTDHVVFAGSWYENHTERCKEMRTILDRLLGDGFKLDIYNRYHGDSDPLHIWPEKYSSYLLPAKPHYEMPDVYKSSVYGLNFNTVTSSSTMFARRVFELMSSNTLVVSNYSQGVDEMFGNLVVFPDRDPERLKSLTQGEVDSIRHKALHEVLEKHTYKQRWRSILQAVGLPFVENDTTLTFTYVVKEREEALSAISWYQQHGLQFSGSRLLLVADIRMDPLDVAKFYQEFNRFGVSVTSMLHAEKYAIPIRYRPVETSHFVALYPGQSVDAGKIKAGALHLQYMTEHLVALAERPDQRHKTAPATADAVVMGSASQFTDWMQRQTKKSFSTVYWV